MCEYDNVHMYLHSIKLGCSVNIFLFLHKQHVVSVWLSNGCYGIKITEMVNLTAMAAMVCVTWL